MTNQAQDKWNVLVYQAGDNNLSGEMVWSLQEMAEVGASKQMDITAQFDPVGGLPKVLKVQKRPTALVVSFPSLREQLKPVRKADVNRAIRETERALKSPKKSTRETKRRSRDFDKQKGDFSDNECIEASASPMMIEAFLARHAKRESRHLLVLSGHGSGAVGDFLRDTNPLSTLTIPELAVLLQNVTGGGDNKIDKIDILGMDACNMSMIEVCYEVRNSVRFLVGSEGFLLNCGWPYRRILGRLKGQSSADPKAVAATIVKEYTFFYSDYTPAGVSVDISAIELRHVGALVNSLKAIADVLKKDLKAEQSKKSKSQRRVTNAVLAARRDAQTYKDEEYVDLWDFCEQLRAYYPGLTTPLTKVQDAIRKAVEISCFSGPMFQHSHGLSIYFPWIAPERVVEDYCKLAFSRRSGWGRFLETYLAATLREMREDMKETEEAERVPALNEALFLIRRNPPYGKRNPPYGKGLFPHFCRVKNFPDTFYPSRCECEKSNKSKMSKKR